MDEILVLIGYTSEYHLSREQGLASANSGLTYLDCHLASIATDVQDPLVSHPFFRYQSQTLIACIRVDFTVSLAVVAAIITLRSVIAIEVGDTVRPSR